MCAGAGATPTLPEGETPRYRSQQNQKATRATQWEAKAPATATEGVRIGNSQSRFPTTLALSCTQPLIEPASQKRKAAKKKAPPPPADKQSLAKRGKHQSAIQGNAQKRPKRDNSQRRRSGTIKTNQKQQRAGRTK